MTTQVEWVVLAQCTRCLAAWEPSAGWLLRKKSRPHGSKIISTVTFVSSVQIVANHTDEED